MTDRQRMPLLLVCGWGEPGQEKPPVTEAAMSMLAPGTVLIHHDLRSVAEGVVERRTTRMVDGARRDQLDIVEFAHGCLSCTLREDLFPLLRDLSAEPGTKRIVVQLDPSLEPETLSWGIDHILISRARGEPAAPIADLVSISAIVTTLSASTWLADATGAQSLAERGWAGSPEDARTVSELVIKQVEMADALIIDGQASNPDERAHLDAVLDRLAPRVPRGCPGDAPVLVGNLSADARRGALDDGHGPLLAREPPLESTGDIALLEISGRRPFHPGRLRSAIDMLRDGVLRTRGRLWLATQPELALWLESTGGVLQIGTIGPWLVALPEQSRWNHVEPHRRAFASLRWDDHCGDRDVSIVVLVYDADQCAIRAALEGAMLTDSEMAAGQSTWSTWDDPFAGFHTAERAQTEAAPETTNARPGR